MPVCWISRRESSDYTFATTAQRYEVFWRIFVAIQPRTSIDRQVRSDQVIDSVCMSQFSWRAWPRSAVRAQPWLLERLSLSHAVHWCVTNCRQAVCSELSLSRHNAGEKSTKLGHEIIMHMVGHTSLKIEIICIISICAMKWSDGVVSIYNEHCTYACTLRPKTLHRLTKPIEYAWDMRRIGPQCMHD